jgi:hypothetical protein
MIGPRCETLEDDAFDVRAKLAAPSVHRCSIALRDCRELVGDQLWSVAAFLHRLECKTYSTPGR